MNLTMSLGHRKRAEQLIHATAKDGADATAQLLRHFPPDVLPALVAYLARVAVDARVLPADPARWQHGQPNRLTDAQRREAHRAYQHGDRSLSVVEGEREYNRHWARQRRENRQASKGSERFGAVESDAQSGPESAATDRGLATISTRPKGA